MVAHVQVCVTCNAAQAYRAYEADQAKLAVMAEAVPLPPAPAFAVRTYRCRDCTHLVDEHYLDVLAVGDCGKSEVEHPDMVWRMKCRGKASAFEPCKCTNYEIKGGTPAASDHPG